MEGHEVVVGVVRRTRNDSRCNTASLTTSVAARKPPAFAIGVLALLHRTIGDLAGRGGGKGALVATGGSV